MKEQKATNVTWHEHKVSREDREKQLGQKGGSRRGFFRTCIGK